MKRIEYIKPFAEFSLIEMDSEVLAGSPGNNGEAVLPGETNPMVPDVNGNVKDQGEGETTPPVDAKGGFTFIWDEF